MAQLYFLSILLNISSAYIILKQDDLIEDSIIDSLKFSPKNEIFRLILGILTAICGLLKLLMPYPGSIPVLGDILPAVAGLAAGFILIFSYYRNHAGSMETEGKLDKMGDILIKWKKAISYFVLCSAVLHFLFPQALFL